MSLSKPPLKIKKNQITALILSGGRGSRMGDIDKGLLMFKNKPLIEHVIERVSSQVSNIVISCNRNIEEYRKFGFPIVRDDVDDFAGPLRGILSAYSLISTPFTMVVPCDVPFLPANLVQRLTDHPQPFEVSCCHDGEREQSLIFIAQTSILPSIENNLLNDKRSVHHWISQRHTVWTDFGDMFEKKVFRNLNAPDDMTDASSQIKP